MPCAQTIMNKIDVNYEHKAKKLKVDLGEIKACTLTTDGGSASNAASFIDVNVHYINNDWKLCHQTLAVREMKESHSAINYREKVDDISEEFEIIEKVFNTTTDNEPKMKSAFKDEERNGCTAHIINSTVQKGLDKCLAMERTRSKMKKNAQKANKSCPW